MRSRLVARDDGDGARAGVRVMLDQAGAVSDGLESLAEAARHAETGLRSLASGWTAALALARRFLDGAEGRLARAGVALASPPRQRTPVPRAPVAPDVPVSDLDRARAREALRRRGFVPGGGTAR